jgi:hypothetical protein
METTLSKGFAFFFANKLSEPLVTIMISDFFLHLWWKFDSHLKISTQDRNNPLKVIRFFLPLLPWGSKKARRVGRVGIKEARRKWR